MTEIMRRHWPAIATGAVIAAIWSLDAHRVDGFFATLGLLLLAVFGAVMLIDRTSRTLGDPALLRVIWIYLAALALVLLVLGSSWHANLTSASGAHDGDQERFYVQAAQLERAGFDRSLLPSLNYTGVLFVYAGVFAAFGSNPFAPALVNAFLTLLAVLLLVRVAYRIKTGRGRFDWLIGLVLLVPEVLLHETMTSRDLLAMGLLSVAILAVADYLLDPQARGLRLAPLLIVSLLLLALVRTAALLPALISIALLLAVFHRRVDRRAMAAIVIAAGLIVAAGPSLSRAFGGYRISYRDMLTASVINPGEQLLTGYNWQRRSIGKLLVPDSAGEAVLLAIPRVLGYLAAPLPSIGVDWSGVARREWFHWQSLLVLLSTLLYLALFPQAIASGIHSARQNRAGLALHIPFWSTMIAVVSGTALIHERYRLMAVPLLWGCIWLGGMAPRSLRIGSYVAWGLLVIGVGIFVAIYKAMPCTTPAITAQPRSMTVRGAAPVTLSVHVTGEEPTYQWYAGASGFIGAPVKRATGPALTVTPAATSQYWVRVSNSCGTVDSGTALVTVTR